MMIYDVVGATNTTRIQTQQQQEVEEVVLMTTTITELYVALRLWSTSFAVAEKMRSFLFGLVVQQK